MDKNQFFYTNEKGQMECFHLDMVIRAVQFGDVLVVLLNDGHEVSEEVRSGKKGNEVQRQRIRRQTEIQLKGEDVYRFVKASSCDGYVIPEKKSPQPQEVVSERSPNPEVTKEIVDETMFS